MLRKVWKFFCSVKLTVVLFILILIPSTVGTIIQQNASDPSQYLKTFGPVWDGIFRYLGFYDIYHDPRFIILLVLLGLNTFACTVNRFRPRWSLLGMMMTHAGLLLILVGALVGATVGVKGFMPIYEGETTNKISLGSATRDTGSLPFEVKLVDFILDMHEEPVKKLLVLDVRTNEQHNYRLEEGKIFGLLKSRWAGLASLFGIKPKASTQVNVKRILPNAAVVASLSEGPEETGTAAVRFRVIGRGTEEEGHALSGDQRPYFFRSGHFGIFYVKAASGEEIESEIQNVALRSKDFSRLEITVPGKALTRAYSAEVGAKFEVEDTGYTVETLRYVPDFVIMPGKQIGSRSEIPNNPALQVRITGPTGSTEQWIFAKFPPMHEPGEGPPFDIKFIMGRQTGHVMDHVLIAKGPEGASVIAYISKGEVVARTEAEAGRPVPIEGTEFEISIDRFFDNAVISEEVVNRPDMPNRPAVEITLGRGASQTEYLLWEETPVDVPGYRMVYVQEERIRDFYSILQIIDNGEVVKEKMIEVNHPLRYGGYSLYQSSYDSEGLRWSGLQVRKDPGVPLVYGGFLLQILGMIAIFYVNPLIKKVKKGRA